jgi:membrane protease YdiL (CAAX protease family)
MSMPEFMSGIERWMRNMENQATEMTDAFLQVDTAMGLMVNLLIIGLLAAVGEELLFRGVILKMFRESVNNVHLAVFFSALLFSAFHGQFYGFVPRAMLGVMFGYIFVWTGSLWVPILLHLLFNSVSVVVAFLYTKGLMDVNYEDFGESSGGWVILLSAFFSVALMVTLYQRHAKAEIKEVSDN